MSATTWVLEPDIFPDTHESLRAAIRKQGSTLVEWSDAWWSDGVPPKIRNNAVVFHGSLGNAAQVSALLDWTPGSFCPAEVFHCSAWYETAKPWLVHEQWQLVPASELVANAEHIARSLGASSPLFVRPDSPLKPFSGRVVDVRSISLAKLDHGFYYEEEALPVVVAPVRKIESEWRFVVVGSEVVAGSAYDAATRKPISEGLDTAAALFASEVASSIPPLQDAYVLDVCTCEGTLHLLELNPFGGADLYACDGTAIVQAISKLIES